MEKDVILKLNQDFEQAAFEQDGIEFWCARDLQELLEYTEWRNFVQVIEKAKMACHKAGQSLSDHFVDVNKTIPMPKGASKEIDDVMLTRYACYLIAQNGDPRKESMPLPKATLPSRPANKNCWKKESGLLKGFMPGRNSSRLKLNFPEWFMNAVSTVRVSEESEVKGIKLYLAAIRLYR